MSQLQGPRRGNAEKGPLGFAQSCLRWWSADHSSHLPPSQVNKKQTHLFENQGGLDFKDQGGDAAPRAVAQQAHPGQRRDGTTRLHLVSLVRVGATPSTLFHSCKNKKFLARHCARLKIPRRMRFEWGNSKMTAESLKT